MKQTFELDLYGKKMSFEVGRLAKQANEIGRASCRERVSRVV